MHRLPPLSTGVTFGDWTVIGDPIREGLRVKIPVRCTCGFEKVVERYSLMSGDSTACMYCSGRRKATQHNEGHAYAKSPEYVSWNLMIQRCCNPNNRAYKLYGGRGITVCEQWRHSFPQFLADVGRRPAPRGYSLERRKNDKGYEPGNVVWATRTEQSRNRRTHRLVEVDGVTKCLSEWAESSPVSPETIRQRLNAGWDPKVAISKPVPLYR